LAEGGEETDRTLEPDGARGERAQTRGFLGEVASLPGVMAQRDTEAEAKAHAISLALRVIADRIDRRAAAKGS